MKNEHVMVPWPFCRHMWKYVTGGLQLFAPSRGLAENSSKLALAGRNSRAKKQCISHQNIQGKWFHERGKKDRS
jgi:hypothetical protein